MKKKSILISAIAMLAVSAIVLSTASYAWFTGSITPSITNVKVGVVERNLLSLSGTSADGTGADWRPVLDTSKYSTQFASGRFINKWMTTTNATNAVDGLDAVTPYRVTTVEGTEDSGYFPIDTSGLPAGAIRINKTPDSAADATSAADMGLAFFRKDVADSAAASEYYRDTDNNAVVMRFMMRADKACSVKLKLKTNADGTDSHTYFDSTATTHPTNDASQSLIDYSLRMAFVFSKEFNPTNAATTLPKTYAEATYDNIVIWSPYADDAEATDAATSTSIRGAESSGWAEGHGYSYQSGKASPTATDVDLFAFTEAMGVREVVCYIWVEGADLDCVDAVAGGLFSALIAFTGTTGTP